MTKIPRRPDLLAWLAILALIPSAFPESPRKLNLFPAQQSKEAFPTPTEDLSDQPLRMDVDLVLVPVMVTDMLNRPITGLEKERFALYQDGNRQQISYFSSEDGPVSVGVLLDLSGSMNYKFAVERAAVSEFFSNANAQDDYFVITFSDHPTLVTNGARSIEAIQSDLATQKPDGPTALFDAIDLAIARMRFAKYRRRALLVISDGGDNYSRHTLRQSKKFARDSDVWVYAIGIFGTGQFRTLEESLGQRWLAEITEATGGRTIAVDLPKVPEAAAAISREIRNQYVLGYKPSKTPHDNKSQKIKIKVEVSLSARQRYTYYKTGFVPPENATLSLYDK